MAVRNIDAIKRQQTQIATEKRNKAILRMEKIDNLMDKVRSANDDIIDAMDTYRALIGIPGSNKLSESKEGSIHLSISKDKRIIQLYCYSDGGRSSNQHYLEYNPKEKRFHGWTRYGWGGFDSWDWDTGRNNDTIFIKLLEDMAIKVQPWCNSIFNFSENL